MLTLKTNNWILNDSLNSWTSSYIDIACCVTITVQNDLKFILPLTSEKQLVLAIKILSFQKVSNVTTQTLIVQKRWVIRCNCHCLKSHVLWNAGYPHIGCVEEDECAGSLLQSINRADYWTRPTFSCPHSCLSDSLPPDLWQGVLKVQVCVKKSCCHVLLCCMSLLCV